MTTRPPSAAMCAGGAEKSQAALTCVTIKMR